MRANLLPPKRHDTTLFTINFDKRELIGAGMLISFCVIVLAGFNFMMLSKLASEQATLNETNAQIVALMAATNDVGQLSADVRRLQQIDRAAVWLKRSGQATALRLAYIGNSIPQSAWIDRVAQDTHGWSIKGAGKDLQTISGVVRGISHVSPGLQTLFQTVNTDNAYSYTMTIVDPLPSPSPASALQTSGK